MIVTRPSFRWVTVGIWLMPLTFVATAVCLLGAFWRELWLRVKADEVGLWPRTGVGRLWWLLLGLGGVSTLLSVRPLESLPAWAGGLGYAITFVVAAWTINTPGRLQQLHKALFGLALAMSVFGLAVWAADLYYLWHVSPSFEIKIGTEDRRINSVMYHPNLLAGFLVLALASGLGLFHQAAAKRRKLLYAVGLSAVALCLVLTSSRAGWIGAGFSFLCFGLLLDRRWLLALVGGAAGAFALFPQLVTSRLAALSMDHPAFDHNRLFAWMSAQQMLLERPLTGWGPGMWPVVYPQFRLSGEAEGLPHAHNFYLHVGVEFGLPVVLTLFAIVVWVLVRAARDTRRTQYHIPVLATICGVLGYMVQNCFDYVLSEGRNAMAFFLLVGAAEAARRMAMADRPPLTRVVPHLIVSQPEEPNR